MLIGYARVSTNEQNLADFSVVLFRPNFMLFFRNEPHENAYESMAFDPTIPS